jgi:hypothetical protein
MKISKRHQCFSKVLNNQRALSHPDEFLGPNWRDVLNFWLYIDTLSTEQLEMANSSYLALDMKYRQYAVNLAWNTASEVTRRHILDSVWWCFPDSASRAATPELMGAHKILEQGKSLTFVPVLLDVCHFKI